MNYTTLNKIRACNPCESGWKKLLASLNKTKADDVPLSLLHILESNGLDDAVWALRASDASQRDIRLYAVWCARQVQHLMTDKRSLKAIDVAERFAYGKATTEEIAAAWAAARAAALDASGAASGAAARDAARDAAWAAALAAARAAAEDAAEDAARAAAEGAAWAAAWAAAEDAAWAAARAAARADQKNRFIEVFCGGHE